MLKRLSLWHNGTLLDFCSRGPWINPRLDLMLVHGKYYKLFFISNNKGLRTQDSGSRASRASKTNQYVQYMYFMSMYVYVGPPPHPQYLCVNEKVQTFI